MNEHVVEFYARAHPDVEIVLADDPMLMAGMAWAVRQGDPDWLGFLNTSLDVLISTGKTANGERESYGRPLRRGRRSYGENFGPLDDSHDEPVSGRTVLPRTAEVAAGAMSARILAVGNSAARESGPAEFPGVCLSAAGVWSAGARFTGPAR